MSETTTLTADEGVMRRLKKLLALATNGAAAPGEAENAMRMAQNLMAKYGVSEGAIVSADIAQTMLESTKAITPPPWEGYLLSEICRAFGGRNLWTEGWGPKGYKMKGYHLVLAPKQRIDLIKYAFEVLSRQLRKERAAYIATLPVWYTRPRKADEGDQFGLGFVHMLGKKISTFAEDDAMKAALDDKKESLKTGKYEDRKLKASHESLLAGAEAGEKANLNRPMNGREEQLQIGGGS